MLNQPTLDKLYILRLAAMAEAWVAQQKDAEIASAGFDERLALLVDAEYTVRENRRVSRNLKQVNLHVSDACLEDGRRPRGGDSIERAYGSSARARGSPSISTFSSTERRAWGRAILPARSDRRPAVKGTE